MEETSTSKSFVQAIQCETATNIMMERNNGKLVQLGTEQGRLPDGEMNFTEGRKSPWLHNNGNFNSDVAILKSDLILPKPIVKVVDNFLWLELDDYTPVELGWGYCLLGFFAGKFPGRNEVLKLTKRWTRATRISYHPNGWIVFRFETEEDMEFIHKAARFDAAGIPLILCPLPKDFRFNSTPEVKFRVWVTLPNLPLALWNPKALGKIATMIGEPVEVDYSTVSKNNIAGPRLLILFNALKQPVKEVNIRMHNGDFFTQLVNYDYYPLLCSKCLKIGHTVDRCRVVPNTYRGVSNPPRGNQGVDASAGWQVPRRRDRQQRVPSVNTRMGRSRSRHEWKERRPGGVTTSRPSTQHQVQPNIGNKHIRFPSSSKENGSPSLNKEEVSVGNKFNLLNTNPLADVDPAPVETGEASALSSSPSDVTSSSTGAGNGPDPVARARLHVKAAEMNYRMAEQRARSVEKDVQTDARHVQREENAEQLAVHHESSTDGAAEQRISSAGNTPYRQQVNSKTSDNILPNDTVFSGDTSTNAAGLEEEQISIAKDPKLVEKLEQIRGKGKVIQADKRGERELGTAPLKANQMGDATNKEKEKMAQVQRQNNNKKTNNRKSKTPTKGGRGGNKSRR